MKTRDSTARKPIKAGCDYLRDSSWQPIVATRESAQRRANRMAKKAKPEGFWRGCVFDAGDYYRICIGGQPESPRDGASY